MWDPRFDRLEGRADHGKAIFRPLREAIEPFRGFVDWPPLEAWNAAIPEIHSDGGARIRFVEMPPKKRRGAKLDVDAIYDERIYTKGEVPSRLRSWHDFFNMLVWATFPNVKTAINARQRAALRARVDPSMTKLPSARTEEQDALAMLDEGGLILATRVDLDDAIERADLEPIVAAIRAGDARAILLGHAIYEHHVVGQGTLRALVHRVSLPDPHDVSAIDAQMGDALRSGETVLRNRWVPGLAVVDALFA
ncbi:MAG: DUF3025 domain-containing protein [Polyangiales bacterium]